MGLISNTKMPISFEEKREINHFILAFKLRHNKDLNIECVGFSEMGDGKNYTLKQLKDIVDMFFKEFRDGIVNEEGIFYPTRKFGYPLFRSFFYRLAIEEGYKEQQISQFSKFHRTNVISGIKKLNDLLDTKDKIASKNWDQIQQYVQKDRIS